MNNPTDKTDSPDQAELKALYERDGQVEPDAGLDRMIRARADEAVSQPARSRTLPWMGGLATAAVLVLAVGVVYQIQPPTAPQFEAEPDSGFMTDEDQAPPAAPPALEDRQLESVGESRSSRAERRQSPAPAQSLRESVPMEAEQAGEELDRVTVTGSRLRYAQEVTEEAEERQVAFDLEKLQAVFVAIENEEFGEARSLLEELSRDHPEHPMIRALEERLGELDPD